MSTLKGISQMFLHVGKNEVDEFDPELKLDSDRFVFSDAYHNLWHFDILNMHSASRSTASTNEVRAELNLCPVSSDYHEDQTGTATRSIWRSQFRIVPLAKHSDLQDQQEPGWQHDCIVRGGDYMELFHAQTQSYLTVDWRST